MNQVHEFVPSAKRLQLRDTKGYLLGWSQEGLLSDGHLCSALDPLVRIVTGVCSDLSGLFCADIIGRLEVRNSPTGTYGTVCDDNWDSIDTQVVCRQLGYEGGGVWINRYCTDGTGPINLDDVNCVGDEESLLDCPTAATTLDCSHAEDVHIACSGSGLSSALTELIGCPAPRASGIQYLGCDQSETIYSINTLTPEALNILNNGQGGGSLPIASESLTSPGGDIVGQMMLENGSDIAHQRCSASQCYGQKRISVCRIPNH